MKKLILNLLGILGIVTLFFSSVAITSCSDDDNNGEFVKNPTITSISFAENDSIVDAVYPENTYIIRGTGFAGTVKVAFNGVESNVNPVFVSDTLMIITISKDTPFGEPNTLEIQTLYGSVIVHCTVLENVPQTVETPIWNGPVSLSWSDGGQIAIPASAFDGVAPGTILKFYFEQTENWGQAQINNGSWSVIPFSELGNDGYLKTDGPMINNDKSVSEVELVLTQAILDNISSHAGDFNGTIAGMIIQGSDWIFNKVSLVTKVSNSVNIWSGTQDMGSWSGSIQLSADLFTNVKVGDIVKVTVDPASISADSQGSFKDGSTWAGITSQYEYFTITGDFEMPVTGDIQAKLLANGLIVSGQKYIAKSVDIVSN